MNVSSPDRTTARRGRATTRRARGLVLAGAIALASVAMAGGPAAPAALAAASSHAASAAATASQPAPGTISWSVSPASATAPDTRSKYTYTNIKPGSTVTDHIAIFNRSSQSVSFQVYGTDAIGTTKSNVLIMLPPNKTPTDIGSWIRVSQHPGPLAIVIPAGSGVIEPISIAVPHQAPPGDHVGAVMVQVSFQRETSTRQVITEHQRLGVPVVLRVFGPVHAGLAVQSISAGFSTPISPFGTGSATVSYTVHNTGNVLLNGSQLVKITGAFGQSATVHLKSLPTVLPGDSVRITARSTGLYPSGPLTAHVSVGPQNPPGQPQLSAQLAAVTGSASLFATPWPLIVLILLVVAIIVGVVLGIRARRRSLHETLNAVADKARQETERRLLGSRKSTAGTKGNA
jgi:hypothetical protein